MTSPISEEVCRLLSLHAFEVDSGSTSKDLKCLLCRRLMRDAYQAGCGCQFCRGCLVTYLRGPLKHCPGSEDKCRAKPLDLDLNVCRNPLLNRMIEEARLCCPYLSCKVVDGFREMSEHLELCIHRPIKCPLKEVGCQAEMVPEAEMEVHLRKEVMAHSHFIMEAHRGVVEEVARLKTEADMMQASMTVMENKVEYLIREVDAERETARKAKEEVEALRAEYAKNKLDDKESLDAMRNELVASQTSWLNAVTSERMRVDFLSDAIDRLDIGTNRVVAVSQLSFTVDRMAERMNDQNVVITSPHFYSHVNGYKLKIEVCPGGDGEGQGSHLSVFLVVCKGEYDGVLPWPFQHAIDISTVNQLTQKDNNTRQVEFYHSLKAFHRPTDADNPGRGFTNFISHEELRSTEGLIVNDLVVFHIAVSPPR